MKDKKQRLTILIISILVLTIGLSYAYYSAVVQGTGNANAEASGKTATIGEVEFNGETTFDSSTLDEIYPGFIGIQEFTISPYKDGTGIYEVDLQASVPQAFGDDIRISVYKTSDKTNNNVTRTEGELTINNNQYTKQDILTITGTLEKVYEKSLTTTTETMIEQVVFAIENNAFTTPSVTPDGYYTYYAVYEYLDNGNQNNQQGLDFEGKITVKYVSDAELGAAAYISSLAGNSPKNSIALIDKGTMYDTDGETEICTNTMAYDDFGNLRYVGENPCNYVTFNDETAGWRIIGVIGNQVKMIRKESIGNYSWDTSIPDVNFGAGINQWGESGSYQGADLMKLLNPGFENNTDSTYNECVYNKTTKKYDCTLESESTLINNSLYWNRTYGYCFNARNNEYTTCDFTETGLTASSRNMIDSHMWHLGSQEGSDYWISGNGRGLAKKFYEYERGSNTGKICTFDETHCNDVVNRTTFWHGYIGLMYPSDYGYAVGGDARDNCLANINLYDYDDNNCSANDWLFISNSQWTMSPFASYGIVAYYAFYVYSLGDVFDASVWGPNVIRPVVFFKSNVKISGGDGTPTNPYTLSLN